MSEGAWMLDAVFGSDSFGVSVAERANSSKVRFVRSQHQLSVFRESASGEILSAKEALCLFGWGALKELADKPATPTLCNPGEPYQSIQERLSELGFSLEEMATRIGWSEASIQRFQQKRQVPFRDLRLMARSMDLDLDKILGY